MNENKERSSRITNKFPEEEKLEDRIKFVKENVEKNKNLLRRFIKSMTPGTVTITPEVIKETNRLLLEYIIGKELSDENQAEQKQIEALDAIQKAGLGDWALAILKENEGKNKPEKYNDTIQTETENKSTIINTESQSHSFILNWISYIFNWTSVPFFNQKNKPLSTPEEIIPLTVVYEDDELPSETSLSVIEPALPTDNKKSTPSVLQSLVVSFMAQLYRYMGYLEPRTVPTINNIKPKIDIPKESQPTISNLKRDDRSLQQLKHDLRNINKRKKKSGQNDNQELDKQEEKIREKIFTFYDQKQIQPLVDKAKKLKESKEKISNIQAQLVHCGELGKELSAEIEALVQGLRNTKPGWKGAERKLYAILDAMPLKIENQESLYAAWDSKPHSLKDALAIRPPGLDTGYCKNIAAVLKKLDDDHDKTIQNHK